MFNYFSCGQALNCIRPQRITNKLNLHMTFRRNAPQKAWSGMNPITQRSTTPAQQNGVGNQPKVVPQKPGNNEETGTTDQHANDRLLFLFANMMVSCPQATHAVDHADDQRAFLLQSR